MRSLGSSQPLQVLPKASSVGQSTEEIVEVGSGLLVAREPAEKASVWSFRYTSAAIEAPSSTFNKLP